MPTEDKTLHEKLDAMVGIQLMHPLHRDKGMYNDYMSAIKAVALDILDENQTLLREKEQRETPCVWTPNELGARWAGCGHGSAAKYPPRFCPGCGHPVQVKQPQDAAEEW